MTYDQIKNDYKFNLDISWIKDDDDGLDDSGTVNTYDLPSDIL